MSIGAAVLEYTVGGTNLFLSRKMVNQARLKNKAYHKVNGQSILKLPEFTNPIDLNYTHIIQFNTFLWVINTITT